MMTYSRPHGEVHRRRTFKNTAWPLSSSKQADRFGAVETLMTTKRRSDVADFQRRPCRLCCISMQLPGSQNTKGCHLRLWHACIHRAKYPRSTLIGYALCSIPQMRHPPGYRVYKDLATAPSTEDLASPETKCQTTTNSTITITHVPAIERYTIWHRLPFTQLRTALRKKDNCQSTSLHWPPN